MSHHPTIADDLTRIGEKARHAQGIAPKAFKSFFTEILRRTMEAQTTLDAEWCIRPAVLRAYNAIHEGVRSQQIREDLGLDIFSICSALQGIAISAGQADFMWRVECHSLGDMALAMRRYLYL